MRIVIPGKPKYQKRHRLGKGKRMYNPSSNDKKAIQKALLPYKNGTPLLGALEVEITAFFPFLESWSEAHIEQAEGMVKVTKPDADNIGKLYADAMNGIIYNDDNQITDMTIRKRYSQEPCVVIDINLK